jgi:type 1 glutamine amidotransferase
MRKVTTSTSAMTRRVFLSRTVATGGVLAGPWLGFAVGKTEAVSGSGRRQRIEAAIPTNAFAAPRKHRRLLIFDLNVGYGGHGSIPVANAAFTLMGERTGAFETVVSRDPSAFKPESLRQFDAVFLNNTVGNLFEDAGLRQSLIEFVYGGGGLLGVHGTSVAFTRWPGAHEDWPEFGIMLGARGANHRDSDEHVFIKLDDPDHPLNRAFGGEGFEYRDEFFRVHEPYSRDKLRVLFSIDTDKTTFQGQPRGNCDREDNDYALAWVRQYGRGRVFYCTIAHNPYVFWDPKMLQFYLAAIQFALGDLLAPTTPSAKLTPAVRAQEQLGWRLGLISPVPGNLTLFAAIDEAAKSGLLYVGGCHYQKVSRETSENFDARLGDDSLRQIRLKLDAAGVRLLTYGAGLMPSDEAGCRRVFEFARKMGVEILIAEPPPEALGAVGYLCDEYDMGFAIAGRDGRASLQYAHPHEVLKICDGLSKRVGVYGGLAAWQRAGVDPIEGVRILRDRLIVLDIGATGIDRLLREVHRFDLKPVMFGVEYLAEEVGSIHRISERIQSFNDISVQLAKRGEL